MAEKCVGCGSIADKHPWVAVASISDLPVDAQALTVSQTFAAVPICSLCHRDPTRRPRFKAHFFAHDQFTTAVEAAGSSDLG